LRACRLGTRQGEYGRAQVNAAWACCAAPAMQRGGERDRRGGRDAQHVDGAAHGAGAQYSHALGQGAQYPLHTFQRGDLLLARNVNRAERYWPVRRNGATYTPLLQCSWRCPACCAHCGVRRTKAVAVDPARDAPEHVRRISQPGRLCVMFYGPAANKARSTLRAASTLSFCPAGRPVGQPA